MMTTAESFLEEIEDFLKRSNMKESAFGRAALGDPNFVRDLRAGRSPGLDTVGKVSEFIRSQGSPPTAPDAPQRARA